MTNYQRRYLRRTIHAAAFCLGMVIGGLLLSLAINQPDDTVQLNIDFGTSCPRPCRFPQLETQS